MKKFIFLFFSAICAVLSANAQIEYVDGSFKSLSESDRATSSSDIGHHNMTDLVIDDWKANADGDDVNGLLVLTFENLTPDEMKDIKISKLSNNQIVSFTDNEIREFDGELGKRFYIPSSSKPFDIDIVHPKYGVTRIPGVKMQRHKVYKAKIRAKGMVSVAVTSTPSGATVIFDNRNVGVTPLTIPNVILGKHPIKIVTPNRNIANDKEENIDVTLSAVSFDFDLMKKKDVVFIADPGQATLLITKDGKDLARGLGKVSVNELAYGTYIVKGFLGGDDNETVVEINDVTPAEVIVKVVPSTAISFTATQNNYPVSGAEINVDGVSIGVTPLTHKVDFGIHHVAMSYMGYTASKRFKVGPKTDPSLMLKLPNRHRSRHNLFDIDYHRKEWGLAFNYVNRAYKLRGRGFKTETYNFYLDEGRESGIQMGVVYQGYYGYGQGLSTGLYWQMFFGTAHNIEEEPSYYEHSLYIPLQYQFRLPLTAKISVFANAGFGFTIGLYNNLKFSDGGDGYSLGYGVNSDYEMLFPKLFDCSLLFGGGVQFGVFQVEAKFGQGLINQSHILEANDLEDMTLKSTFWQVGCSFVF